ncbi:MAG: hypothetical protein ABI672_09225 [Vicinamibacteria bacterium]
MSRLLVLLGLAWRTRLRGFSSSGGASIFLILGGLFYLALTLAMGIGAYFALTAVRAAPAGRVADLVSLVVTSLGVLFLTRPLILSNLSGGSLQNLLHLPIRRSELFLYSFLTGIVTPLVFEAPVLIGAALGAARHPLLIAATLPLALLAHVILLAGAHMMSLVAVFIARRAWVADLARLFAFSLFFLPSLLSMPGTRSVLRPLLTPLVQVSPLSWAARATVYAGAGDGGRAALFVLLGFALLAGISLVSTRLLGRIIEGEGADRVNQRLATPRRARVFLPGALGALIETQMRTQLRTPAARMALFMPTMMMALFAFSLARQGQQPGTVIAMVLLLSIAGGNAFGAVGRGVAMILGTPVSRASFLVANDIATFLFRLPPLVALLGVTAWQNGAGTTLSIAALGLAIMIVGMGVQHFVAILKPFALPRDRMNPFAQRIDGRQSGNGLVSFLATISTVVLAAPFLFLAWLSTRIDGGYGPWLLVLAFLGALATYAVLIALAERLLLKRELQVLEVLLDDSPS